MRLLWLFLLFLVYTPLIYLITLNWDDDKIRDIGFSILLVAGVVGLVSVWNTLKVEPSFEEFNVSIVAPIEDVSKQLSHLKWKDDMSSKRYFPPFPDNFDLSYSAQEFNKSFPDEFKKDVWLTYRDLIGYNILDVFYKNFKLTWLTAPKKIETEFGGTTVAKNRFENVAHTNFTWKDLTKNLDPQVYKVAQLQDLHSQLGIKVPPEVVLTASSNKDEFTILIESKFSRMKIVLFQDTMLKGFGQTGYYMGLTEQDHDKYYIYSFRITIDSEIKKTFSGSRESENHRIWFSTIKSLLRENFDFEIYLKRLKEWRELKAN